METILLFAINKQLYKEIMGCTLCQGPGDHSVSLFRKKKSDKLKAAMSHKWMEPTEYGMGPTNRVHRWNLLSLGELAGKVSPSTPSIFRTHVGLKVAALFLCRFWGFRISNTLRNRQHSPVSQSRRYLFLEGRASIFTLFHFSFLLSLVCQGIVL